MRTCGWESGTDPAHPLVADLATYTPQGRHWDALCPQHQKFLLHWLWRFRAGAAYLAAGYESKDPSHDGGHLLHRPFMWAAACEQLNRIGITEDRILCEYAQIAFDTDMADQEPVLRGKALAEARKLGVPTGRIRKIKITRRWKGSGEGAYEVEDVDIELHDKMKALDALARTRAMFVERVETKSDVRHSFAGMTMAQLEAMEQALGEPPRPIPRMIEAVPQLAPLPAVRDVELVEVVQEQTQPQAKPVEAGGWDFFEKQT